MRRNSVVDREKPLKPGTHHRAAVGRAPHSNQKASGHVARPFLSRNVFHSEESKKSRPLAVAHLMVRDFGRACKP